MTSIRCSSLPLFFACAPALDGEIQISARNEASDLGSAAHQAVDALVADEEPDLDAIARRWACKRDELGRLTWYARKAWEVLAPSFPNDEEHSRWAEKSVRCLEGDIELTGHIDMHTVCSDGTVRIVDWKTGRVDRDYYHQLAGYAACIMYTHKEITQVTVSVVWLREQEIETYVITRPVIDQWLARLRQQVERRGQFSTGRHCEHCPRSHSCEAVKAKAREGIEILGKSCSSGDLVGLPPEEVVGLYRRARLVEKVCEAMVASIRLHVSKHGPQDAGDGTKLALVDEKGGRDIDTAAAWDIIRARFPEQDDMAAVLKVRASDLDAAVAKAAGKGKGAEAKRALAADLEAAGAVSNTAIQKLKEQRTQKETT